MYVSLTASFLFSVLFQLISFGCYRGPEVQGETVQFLSTCFPVLFILFLSFDLNKNKNKQKIKLI